jgi:dihydroxyacetone kinase-like predicted kinase
VPQGIAALLAFNYQADLTTNIQSMAAAPARLRTIELTHATRSARVNGVSVRQGQPIALLEGELIGAGDDPGNLLIQVLERADARSGEIVTIYSGSDVTAAEALELCSRIKHKFPEQEIELHSGGQPLYPYIVSIE